MDRDTLQHNLLIAMLGHVVFDGWSERALTMARQQAGITEAQALHAFPHGAIDVLDYFMEYLDKRMAESLSALPLAHMKLHEKVSSAILLRLKAAEPHREAIRKAVAHYALPLNAARGLRRLYCTTDAIWRAIGDHPTDFSFYTKRLSLGMIYSSTLLFWLDDHSENAQDTAAFLQRRLANLFSFHRFKGALLKPFSQRRGTA